MFTWNLQYISKTRLSETLNQLRLSSYKGDILVRIHTAFHTADEAVELASFIKNILPEAHIFGTSTSAVIRGGRLLNYQCVISITQMSEGTVKCIRIPLKTEDADKLMDEEKLCDVVKDSVISDDTGLVLVFFPDIYSGIKRFTDLSNDKFPGVRLLGGVVNNNDIDQEISGKSGFVFDENGWSDDSMIAASLSGEKFEALGYIASGMQSVGDEMTVTKTDGRKILEIDGKSAPEVYREIVGEEVRDNWELIFLFPLAYKGEQDVPFFVGYSDEALMANHRVEPGKKLKRGFFYDGKVIADNRRMFGKMETFEKAETIFGYACRERYRYYTNFVKWELSVYQDTNICGCLTEGEIGSIDGRNYYSNCAFAAAVAGENEAVQRYNPYVFSNTDTLAEENKGMIRFLMDVENRYGRSGSGEMPVSLRDFVWSCEQKLLYNEKEQIPNEAAFNMDIKTRGYDRVCIIEVLDTMSMRMVFSEQMIDLTHQIFISRCSSFVADKPYRFYLMGRWHVAVAAPSYMISLQTFSEDMRLLQKKLFEAADGYISIIPVFCLINGCTVENIKTVYNEARLEMTQKNEQFYICDDEEEKIDVDDLRERYHMVNVINYAISHDRIIPYFQGVYDNKKKNIYHYESLMRLADEKGNLYYPASFLDVARSYGLLYDVLSFGMIKKVFEVFKDLPDKTVSINLGIRDINNDELTSYIFSFLATAKYPGNFIFEILENEDVEDYDFVVRFIDKIHNLGGLVSIDDFGSGYSNLQHIVNIHFDYVKIDGSIVKRCCDNHASENLVALIAGWKHLSDRNVKIVAEYVENEDIQNKLTEYDIDFSQGYLFSKPAPELLP